MNDNPTMHGAFWINENAHPGIFFDRNGKESGRLNQENPEPHWLKAIEYPIERSFKVAAQGAASSSSGAIQASTVDAA